MNPNFSKIKAVTAGKTKTSGISPFSELEISKVYPNPDQPRKQFDDIEELASTIKEHGLLQPITVVKKDDGYMIVSGERRYKAHLFNEAKTIKAHIIDVSEDEIEELALIENIQRNDLTDFEIAKGIVKRWNSGRYEKKSDLAKKIGKSESYVSKAFSALKLNDDILEDIETNKKDISVSVMDEISRVKDKDVQKEVYQKYSDGEITRDEIKEYKEQNFNETFNFTKDVWTKSFFDYIKQDWVFKKLKDEETYELKIKEVSTYTNVIQDDISEISFVLNMTKSMKDAFKSKFYSYIENKCKLLEIGKYYKVIIKPTGRIIRPIFKKEEVEEAEKDLVDQAKTFIENFPAGNLEASFRVDDLIQDKTQILEARIKELEKEIEELNNKEVFIVGYISKKGDQNGAGFRCRALNENEAIEIAKKENYHNLANDKNIIWEARTLKSGCNEANIFNDHIGYGFGTVNDIGTYIAVIDGDFEATITFEKNSEFVKNTNNKEYQVIIKEIEKQKETKQPEKTTKSLKDKKEIKLLELFGETVTITYTDNDMDMGLDYKNAKKIIDESTQASIPFDVCKGTEERAYKLIDKEKRTIKDDCIVFISKRNFK